MIHKMLNILWYYLKYLKNIEYVVYIGKKTLVLKYINIFKVKHIT